MIEQATVEALAAARRSGEKLASYPGPAPTNLTEAFALQCAVRDRLGWRQAGWKIGCTSERAQKALKADGPFPGPLYAERLYRSGAYIETLPGNSRTTEPEIAFTLARDLPARGTPYTVDEALAAVASVHPSIEIVNPRLPRGFDDAVEWYVADGGLNHALVLGDGVAPLARDAYAKETVAVKVNGIACYAGVGSNALGGPEKALAWLANHLIERAHFLKAGDVVSTGVITEVFETVIGDGVEARYSSLGTVSVKMRSVRNSDRGRAG